MRYLCLIGVLSLTAAACSSTRSSPTSPTTTTPPSSGCTYTISSTTLNMAATGGTATIAVTTGSTCAWTATSNATFVSITSGSSQTGGGNVSFAVAPNTGAARTATVTIAGQTIAVNQAADDAVYGNWSGTIASQAPCGPGLPTSVSWTGVIRRNAAGNPELVLTAATLLIVNQVLPLTISGNTLQFTVQVDALYTFTATLAADRRSLQGTFSGFSCNGTWTGTHQ